MKVQFGLAGPLSGADGNYILVAEGANVENGMPMRDGAKTIHNEIDLLKVNARGSFYWEVRMTKLPFPVAYSVCYQM